MRRTLQRVIQTGRPPTPGRLIDAATLHASAPASASLGMGTSLTAALSRLDPVSGSEPIDRTLLVPDYRRAGSLVSRTVQTAMRWLAEQGAVSVGIPSTLERDVERRIRSLAADANVEVTDLGAAGWNRVMLGERSAILAYADVPAALAIGSTVVALSSPAGHGSLGLWSAIVHPNTALRARLAAGAVVELSAAVDARYLLVAQVGAVSIAGSTAHPIVAELLARAIERLRDRASGVEAPGPWEDAGVQHLVELEPPSSNVARLALHVRLEDNAGDELARRLSEMLGWRLVLSTDRDARGDDDGE